MCIIYFIIRHTFLYCSIFTHRAPSNRTRWNLSSTTAWKLKHSLRAKSNGVLVGINTLVKDNPQLNVRNQLDGVEVKHLCVSPIVLDSYLSLLSINIDIIKLRRPIVCCCLPSHHPRFLLAQTKLAELGGSLVSCRPDKNGR